MDHIVDVLVATYNHEAYIEQCLKSILNQRTRFQFRVIVGEDCSTDATAAIIQKLHSAYPQLVYPYFNKENLGVLGPKGNSLKLYKSVTAKYVAMLDGDDYWTDEFKLQKQVDFLEANPEFVACHHAQLVAKLDENGKYQERPWSESVGDPPEIGSTADLFQFTLRPQSRTLVFRNVFSENDFPAWFPKVRFGDIALSFILAEYGKFLYLNEPMAVYRITGSGASSVFNTPQGRVQGNLAWLELWGYALKMHGKSYRDDAMVGFKVILDRLKKIKQAYPESARMVRRFIRYKLKADLHVKLQLLRYYKG